MSKEYYYEIICRLDKQLTNLASPNFDLSVPLNREFYSAIKQTSLYLKTIIETDFDFTPEDSRIIESLALRNQSFILPLLFGIFVASFSASTFNSLITANLPALIAGIIIIIFLFIFSKLLSQSYNQEIFPFTLIGFISGILITNIHISVKKPVAFSGPVDLLVNSSIELSAISFFLIMFLLLVITVLNRHNRVIKFIKRMQYRKIFEIYKNYQERIDEIANIKE